MFKGRCILPVFMVLVLMTTQAQADNILTIDQAYAEVLDHNPQIRSYLSQIKAAEGKRVQQSLSPNPEAVFEAENFAGDDTREGFDGAEYTLGIEQQIEIAGKRSKREAVAIHEKEQVKLEAIANIQAMLAQTNAAYMQVAIAQERLQLAKKRVSLADQTHETVKKRINAAKSTDIQHTKADIEVSAAEVAQRKAEKDLNISKSALANLLGRSSLEQEPVANLTVLPDIPTQETVMQTLDQMPISIMSRHALMKQEAALDLARANALPDPTFGLGVRRFAEDDSSAFLASISIPIPVFNRNQGAIAEAKANVLAASADQEAQRFALTRQAMELWQTLVSAKEEVLAYQDGLLPSAQKAHSQAGKGFDRGAFSFLDLLDAQRTLFDVQESHLEALDAFYQAKAQVDMLSGVYAEPAAIFMQSNNKE